MGTRSTIAIEFADNTVSQVYCHWDGYLDHNGSILAHYYIDPFKVRDLIDLGDFSSLRHTVEETKGGAYAHSRGETGCEASRYMDITDYFEECQQEEYDYILRQIEGKAVWFVRCYSTDGKWVTLGEAQAMIDEMNKQGAY